MIAVSPSACEEGLACAKRDGSEEADEREVFDDGEFEVGDGRAGTGRGADVDEDWAVTFGH